MKSWVSIEEGKEDGKTLLSIFKCPTYNSAVVMEKY